MTARSRLTLRRLFGSARPSEAQCVTQGMPDLEFLAPLLECLPPAPPPHGLLTQIDERIGAKRRARQRRLPRFRLVGVGLLGAAAGAMAALALAPVLDIGVSGGVSGGASGAASGAPLWLEVTEGAERVAMLSARTLEGGRYLRVDHFGLSAPAGGALELWLVSGSSGGPESLGLLAARRGVTVVPLGHAITEGDLLAVSEEPSGGAPGPGPSGSVILTARVGINF